MLPSGETDREREREGKKDSEGIKAPPSFALSLHSLSKAPSTRPPTSHRKKDEAGLPGLRRRGGNPVLGLSGPGSRRRPRPGPGLLLRRRLLLRAVRRPRFCPGVPAEAGQVLLAGGQAKVSESESRTYCTAELLGKKKPMFRKKPDSRKYDNV